ncbi:50S ribosomal protein L6 [Arenimonas sp.]|nr:50S ribosomal protein L6 [Candidatus Parcubacteria bacterium]
MSRIGKQITTIPAGTTVSFTDGVLTVKGPKGELTKKFLPIVEVVLEGSELSFKPKQNDAFGRSLWGTYSSHAKNMIAGVNTPYVKKLILEGVGYKGEVAGNMLKLALGFSHPVNVEIPTEVAVIIEKGVYTFTSIDKEAVGSFAAKIRSLKKPEPYKGKGFRYDDEIIKRKQGKKAA